MTDLRDRRASVLAPSLSIAYGDAPLHVVRGEAQYLHADDGRRYLDCVNNVCHVGHCHPRVVAAGQAQLARLNTNTRYLHESIVAYAEELGRTFPAPLGVCFFVNSGSEANDLALRIARAATRDARGVIVLDHAYHGHTAALIDVSPYKFNRRGGLGRPPHVEVLPCPDGYRGAHKYADPQAGVKYAAHVAPAVERLAAAGHRLGAFIAESALGCAGQVFLPNGFLCEAYATVRAAGGVCIADEVQVGFGRMGTDAGGLWAFEREGVVPDIVTLGKPIGNGFPLAAVVTTRALASAFANGMEYFNTFGGNPVAMEIGLAVLRVVRDERLAEHALRLGAYWLAQLRQLQSRHTLIGDVRGVGLFIGVELVLDSDNITPAPVQASFVSKHMRANGVLVSTDGPYDNVLKIKPPMCITAADVDDFVRALDEALKRAVDFTSNMPSDRARALAHAVFGVDAASCKRLPSYEDQNFLLTTAAGTRLVFKIASARMTHDDLLFENAVMEHLQPLCTASFAVPRAIASSAGETIVYHAPTNEHLRLLQYVPGKLYADVMRPGPALIASLGRVLAKVDVALADLDVPHPRPRDYWDLAIGARHVSQALESGARLLDTALVAEHLRRYEASVVCDEARRGALRTQIIFGDANDHNVLVSDNELSVVGLIDFGDTIRTHLVNELAIALAYVALPQPADGDEHAALEVDFVTVAVSARTLVRAYEAVLPLNATEREALLPLVCLRLCVSVVTSQRERAHQPGNEYISVSERGAWALLRLLRDIEPAGFVAHVFGAA